MPDSIDFIFSSAVMEHVAEVDVCYQSMYRCLKLGGVMSHQVDYSSHGVSSLWNGHYRYSDEAWRIIFGGRQHLINRLSHSDHLRLLAESGFDSIIDIPQREASEIKLDDLAPIFWTMDQQDLTTRCALLQAVKPQL